MTKQLVQHIEEMHIRLSELAGEEQAVVHALGDALNQHDQQLLRDVRTIAPDHERRREDILGELQGLARGIGMFRQPPAPPQSPEELPPYRRANGLRERIIALGDGRQVTSNSSSLTIIPK